METAEEEGGEDEDDDDDEDFGDVVDPDFLERAPPAPAPDSATVGRRVLTSDMVCLRGENRPLFFPPPEEEDGGDSSQSMVMTSHSPVSLSSLYITGKGTPHDAEYTRTSESCG